MLVVPVSMAAVTLPTDMAVPWTVNAVGCPVSRCCWYLDKARGRLTGEREGPVVRSTRDIDVVDRTRVQTSVRGSWYARRQTSLVWNLPQKTHQT